MGDGMSNIIDIKTRKPAERLDIDENLPIARYLDVWKKRAKENKIKTLLIIGINEENGVQWDIKDEDFYHLIQLYMELDVMKQVVYGMVYPDSEEFELVDE